MAEDRKIDVVNIFISEIERKNKIHLQEEKIFMQMKKSLCNDVLYTDSKYKESTFILTHIFNNLMADFVKEVSNCVNKVGAYKDE